MFGCDKQRIFIFVAAIFFAAGGRADTSFEIMDVWARATVPTAKVGAVYFVVHNQGDSADHLVQVTSPVATKSEMHTSIVQDNVMKMEKLHSVPIISNQPTVFKPGGHHVMLMGLNAPLVEGDTFPLTLIFEESGPIEVLVNVRNIGFMEQDHEHGDHQDSHDMSHTQTTHSHESD